SGTCTTDASYDSGNANHALYNIGGDFSYNAGSFGIGTAAHTGDITLYQFTSSFDLELVTTGTINISGAFGSDNSLTLQGDSGINISHNITTKGDQFYKGSVALMNDVSLTSNNGKIQFDATINSDATARALTLSTANGTEFLQAVGGAQQLSQLTVSNGTATLGADISTTGNQSYAGQVILSGGTHTVTSSDAITMGAGLNGEGQGLIIAGNFNFSGTASNLASLTVNGTSTLNGAITTFSTQSYTGAMTLAGNTQLSTDNSGITLGSTVTGLHTLSLNTGTTAFSLNHDVISTAGFNVTSSNITLGADVTTTGNQTYTGAVTLADHRTLTAGAGSLITMTGNLIGGNNSLTIADANWSLAGGNASSLSALSVGGTSLLAGDITTTGSQTYSNGVTLEGVRTLSGSTLTFDSTVTGNDQNLTLTSTTGDTTFKGAVSQFATMLINGTLNLQNTGFIQNVASFSVSGSSVLAGNVTTSGSQSYAGAVTLSGSRALSGSTLTFDNTVTGNNQNLALTGNTTFNGDVSELAAVTINGSLDLLNSSTIQNTASLSVSGATNLTGTVNTANNQTYNGLLTLNGVNTLTSTAGSIGMNNGLNAGNTNFTLAGDWIFSGSTSNLSSLTVSRTSQINGAITTTAGSQAYQGAVTLTGTTNLSAVGQSITFSSSVNGAQQLTTTAATTTFNGFVGNSVRLSNLTVNGATQVNGGGIHTSGNQSYLGGFNANSNTNLNSASGNINLDQAAAANNNLEVRGYNLQFKNITTGGTLTLSAGNQLLYSAGTNLSSSGAMTLAVNQSGNTAGVTLDLNGLNLAASSILLQGSGYDRLQGLTNSGNTWQVTGNGSGTLSNAAFNAGGGNTATFSDFAHLYGGESADTFNISGVHNGNIYAGGGNDIIRLQGNGRVNGQVDGGTGTNTYDISATSSPMTLIWGSGFTGIQSLIGSGDTLQGGASGDTEWALLSATGGNINTASFTGFSTLISGSGGDNNFTSNGQYSGTLQLQGQRNYWNYSQGSTLTRGSVLGNGSLTVDTPAGGVAGNMNIGNGDLLLPNLLNHTGTLFIGSRITPAQLPLGGSSNATINTSSLTVSQAINTGGSLVLMAGDITLSGTSIQVGESISLIATGEGCNGCSTGLRANGDLIVSRETTITAQSGRVIAANGIVNATDLILDFNGGDFELAVSAEQQDTSQPSPLSNARGVQLSANTSAFIRNLGLNLVSVSVSFANPAASIMGVRAIEVIDLALFEEDLTLFGRLGEGVALAFAQCEEVEGCTPDVTVEELTASINELELRIQQLEAELKSTTDPERRKELEQMLAEYRAQQEEFMAYRTDLQDFTGFEQQFEDEFGAIGEDDIDMEALEREVAMIETIYTRVRFLESLQFNRERREVFAERTGLDLSDERLSQIIESTLKAASRSEARIEKMLDGN
ncbi:MAG: hypothetical protein IBX50_05380, partial [Marinospirillum sp.]|uniref:beta strand repeat-containing protein n=1 Tax=Marinospirillum sp. TaxID=2183934 RepID=UPI0019F423AE